jgi:hypothetical protein
MKGQGEDASGLLCYFFAEEEREKMWGLARGAVKRWEGVRASSGCGLEESGAEWRW